MLRYWSRATVSAPKTDRSFLVIGALTVDLLQYRNITETYRGGIDVIIAGRLKKGGRYIYKNFWTKTDDRGYFFLANVPPGEYALRGFRIQVLGPAFHLLVFSRLRSEKDPYEVVQNARIPVLAGYFPFPARGRIVNLRHNYFILDHGIKAIARNYFKLENLKLVTGRTITEPDVLTYFKQTFPGSGWFGK